MELWCQNCEDSRFALFFLFSIIRAPFPNLRSSRMKKEEGRRRKKKHGERVTIYSGDLAEPWGRLSCFALSQLSSSFSPSRWCCSIRETDEAIVPLLPRFLSSQVLATIPAAPTAATNHLFAFFSFFLASEGAAAFHPFLLSCSYTLWPRYLCLVQLINI